MPEQVASEPGAVLAAIRQRLVDDGVFLEAQVALGLLVEPQPIAGGMFCRIDPGEFAFDENDGLGRAGLIARSGSFVRVYARRDTDTPQQDTRAITSLFAKATQVVDSLHLFSPEDGSGNPIVIEGIRFRGYGRSARYTADRQWIYLSMPLEIAVQVGLSAPDGQTCS